MRELKIARTTETRSTCPYCSVSCGVIIHTLGDKAKNVKPARWSTSRATLTIRSIAARCVPRASPSGTTSSIAGRLKVPKVRRPGSDKWEEISWDAAIAGIARHIKTTRDKTFVATNAKGETVNRTPGIVMIGGCTDTNEFNFLQWKVSAGLGVTYRDTQARV